jgi:signal transduction histidine kinase
MPRKTGPAFAKEEQLRAELAQQYRIIRSEYLFRLLLVGLGYTLCALFVAPLLMVILFLVELIGEGISQRMLSGLDPSRTPGRYRAYLMSLVPMEAAIITAAGLVWLQDDPYAKAIAIGIVMASLLHLCSVRSIHLPLGLTGLATAAVFSVGFNTYHWITVENWIGLAISTVTVAAAFGYAATAMLSNNRLHRNVVEAAATARAANVAQGRFLAQISHELRTPLNAVIGLAEIEAAKANGSSKQRLHTVVTSARDLAVMLDDAVDYSALTEGRVTVTPRAVTVQREIAASLMVFDLQARNQGRELVVRMDHEVPSVLVIDSQRIRQCLGNLVSNALKHSSRGPVTVTVTYSRSQLVIDVADQGKGIAPALHERVFEPFYRGAGDTPGVGLGLSISRAIARQMSGDLVIVPSPQGTTFRLSVPARAAQGTPQDAGTGEFRNRTILVVDDIATNRLVAGQLLIAAGAQVIEASSGPEALKLLEAGGVDAVLLDLMMPGMDGAETLRHIRDTYGRRIPVIAMTADALAVRRDDDLRKALDGFLPKPILPETLNEVLGRVLSSR